METQSTLNYASSSRDEEWPSRPLGRDGFFCGSSQDSGKPEGHVRESQGRRTSDEELCSYGFDQVVEPHIAQAASSAVDAGRRSRSGM